MNLSQVVRKARFEVDAIRASGVTSALWSDEECIDAANTAMDQAARMLRLADSKILTKSVKSTDTSTDYGSEVYSPSVLAMAADTVDYTLPPDFVRIDSIIPLTTDYEGIRFYPASLAQKGWTDQSTLTVDDTSTITGSESIFFYTVIGSRTLRVRPIMSAAFDIEIMYQYRPPRLQNYSTGSITLASASTELHGIGTSWVTGGLRNPADVVTTSASLVSLSSAYPRIASFTNDTTAVLSRAWPLENLASSVYHISMIPQLPEEHHGWLAQVTAAIMLRKVSPELSTAALAALEKQLTSEVQPEVTIRQVQESLVVDEYTLP
jgi:hypothetical protein